MSRFGSAFQTKLSDFFDTCPLLEDSALAGGDKPRPYLFGETSFVVAGFIPISAKLFIAQIKLKK